MSGFQLYDELNNNNNEIIKWETLCPALTQLDKENAEIIFAIIIHYYWINNMESIQNGDTNFPLIPYNGNLLDGGKGIIIKFESLPSELQMILSNYIRKLSE